MSDPSTETTTVPTDAGQAPASVTQPAEPESFDADYVRKLRAEAAKYRTEAKANADAAKRLAAFEESQKSEQEKLAERAAGAEAELQAARAESLRLRVAAEAGLPADLQEFLTASDEDGLKAQAEKLKAVAAAAAKPVDLGQGQRGAGRASQLTRADLASMTPDQIVQAKAEGRLNDLLGITK